MSSTLLTLSARKSEHCRQAPSQESCVACMVLPGLQMVRRANQAWKGQYHAFLDRHARPYLIGGTKEATCLMFALLPLPSHFFSALSLVIASVLKLKVREVSRVLSCCCFVVVVWAPPPPPPTWGRCVNCLMFSLCQ